MAFSDTELLGRPVPKGQIVATLLAGANRDPEVFDQPNQFDILRPNSDEHLSFSAGIHYCLGAPLARLESAIALRTIATEMPDLQLAGKRERRQGSLIRGVQHFPVIAARSAKATVI
jgi:cytochrome P450